MGVDVGIENLAVCSGGAVVENPRVLKPALGCLRRLARRLPGPGTSTAGLYPAIVGSGCMPDGGGCMSA